MAPADVSHKKAAAAVPVKPATSYRDDPDAVSMHTTRSDYDYDDVPELPSYSDSVAAETYANTTSNPTAPADEYQVIREPTQRSWRGQAHTNNPCPSTAIGNETSIRMDDRLLNAQTLHDYTDRYLRNVPPRPAVRIQGWHWETKKDQNNKKEQRREYDFDIVLGMQAYLPSHCDPQWATGYAVENSDKTFRGSFRKTRAPGYKQDIQVGSDSTPNLMDWCEDFASSKSALRIFRVSRSVVGWDADFLKDNLVPLIRSTHYRGHIDITFPIADKNVDIYTPHWVNRARISWVRWIFYLTFLWIFTWPILYFLTKRWAVYHVQWRYSAVVTDEQGRSQKRYCSISERDWLQQHSNLIQSLVMDKFHGDGTDLPVNVNVDVNRRRSGITLQQTGNRNVDAAVNFIQGSVSAWNTLHGRADSGGWGADS